MTIKTDSKTRREFLGVLKRRRNFLINKVETLDYPVNFDVKEIDALGWAIAVINFNISRVKQIQSEPVEEKK
jgi:hypothetical protein